VLFIGFKNRCVINWGFDTYSEKHSGAQMNLNGGCWMLRFNGTSPMLLL
jgi:hypothetical protein